MKAKEPYTHKPMTHADVAQVYREKLDGNPFGIEPLKKCTAHKDCPSLYDPHTETWSGGCTHHCAFG